MDTAEHSRRTYVRRQAVEALQDVIAHASALYRNAIDAGCGVEPVSDQHRLTVADIEAAVAEVMARVPGDRYPHGFAVFLAALADKCLD